MTLVEFVRSHAPGLFGEEITRHATDEELAALIEFHNNYIRAGQEAQYWKELMNNICNAIKERTKGA